MNSLATEKTMSIREIAEFTGRDRETVRAHTSKLYPYLLQNGVQTLLNENQSSDIIKSLRMKNTPNLQKNMQVFSRVDEDKIIKQAYALLEKRDQENVKLIESLTEENQKMLPKVEFYDTVTQSDDTLDMKKAVDLINIKGYGRTNTFKLLRKKGILTSENIPYRKYQDMGYFRIIENTYRSSTFQEVRISVKTVVYQKGIDYIRNIILIDKASETV